MTRVVDSQRFILGEDVQRLEAAIAEYSGAKFAVACASGSDALYLSLLALGIGAGDRVLTTPYTFFATAGEITHAGAEPVFADIDPLTYNLDPAAAARLLESTAGIKAIIPVHLFGGCADMDAFADMGRRHGCALIEDGAQAIGATYRGRRALSMGDIGCLSFFPTKNLGAFGDGGMLTSNDEHLARKLASLRLHGSTNKYYHDYVGINSRLDTLQAAVLRVKLRHLDTWTEGRRRNAALYRGLLGGRGLPIRLPAEADYQTRHIYNQFVIRAAARDRLKDYLRENGVATEIYYPLPLHMQACYRNLGYPEGSFPHSEAAARQTLALPIHSALTEDDIAYIAGVIQEFYRVNPDLQASS
jgi:dTDP-4-amino-4,6-dideoxygalactose transaminase